MDNQATSSGWVPDILGNGYEMMHIAHPDDYSGPVRSTVIRELSPVADTAGRRAVLYVHGYSDYFFQHEMGDMFVSHGYDFYAVDLRKYGRSLLPGQKMFQVRDMREYFADISGAVEVMRAGGVTEAVLLGHSTGGLTSSLYMADSPSPLFRGLMLNSPFLDWNLPAVLRRIGIPIVSALGRLFPGIKVRQKPDDGYARSLADWGFSRDWKPDVMPDPDAGWVRAIHEAQEALRREKVKVPVLLMHSSESVRKGDGLEKYFHADAILDVDGISRYGRSLGPEVTEVSIKGGLHDLVLSGREVREKVYAIMLAWLREHSL